VAAGGGGTASGSEPDEGVVTGAEVPGISVAGALVPGMVVSGIGVGAGAPASASGVVETGGVGGGGGGAIGPDSSGGWVPAEARANVEVKSGRLEPREKLMARSLSV
jgi:hypothetical protein